MNTRGIDSKNQNLEDETTKNINLFSSRKERVSVIIGTDLKLTKIGLRLLNIQKEVQKLF